MPACAKRGAPPAAFRERKDALGRTVRLPPPERVKRIVSLAPSSTEILYAIGAGPSIVGIDGYSDFPEAVRALPRLGADVDPSLEKIVGLRPDVVYTATSANNQRTAETLERLGVPVYVSRADSLEEIYADIDAIGDVAGHRDEAARLIARMRERIAAVAARHHATPAKKALIVVWSEPLMVAGSHSHVGDLLRAAGGENIADDSPQPFPTYSLERVIVRAPEVVIVGTHSGGAPPMASLTRLAGSGATRRFRIEQLDGDLLFRPGPRVADGVERLEALLYPSQAPR